VASLTELVRRHTDLDGDDTEWLQRLQADWQIIADLSFADLVLWLRDRDDRGFWAVAQIRPTTGPTAFVDDVVGSFEAAGERRLLEQAWAQVRAHDPFLRQPGREERSGLCWCCC
jgi:hypothetical protein